MLFTDTYQTILKPAEGIFRDRGSRFIGYAFPIKSEDHLKNNLSILRTEHPKARHFCWAMRMSTDRSVFRLNDDGEPSGTAGRPILNTLLSRDLTNIQIVVVRYFGGTLLGVPGLINAYKTVATEALNNAEIILQTICDVYRVKFDYQNTNQVMKIIKDYNLDVLAQNFDMETSVEIAIRKSDVNKIIGMLENIVKPKPAFLRTI